MSFVDTDKALDEVGEYLVAEVVKSQRDKGMRASGASAKSTRHEVSGQGQLKKLQLIGMFTWRFQQRGRGPGKYKYPSRKLVEAITEWVKYKGLSIPPYAIAFKINRDGIKVPNRFNPGNVLSEPLNPNRVRGLLKTKMRPIYIQAARSILFD